MGDLRGWAWVGAALLNPVAAMFWLELRRGKPPSPGLAAVSLAGAACAAVAAPRPRAALASGAAALAGSALAGLALDAWVAALDSLDAAAVDAGQ